MAKVMLTSLTPREAVADALYRCILGIDSNDHDLFETACVKDDSLHVTAGAIDLKGWTAFNDFFQRIFCIVTTHTITNIRIDLKDGAETASMTAHCISYHIRPEEAMTTEITSYTAASLYNIDLIKDSNDGLWKIKKWDLNALWSTGDPAVLHG